MRKISTSSRLSRSNRGARRPGAFFALPVLLLTLLSLGGCWPLASGGHPTSSPTAGPVAHPVKSTTATALWQNAQVTLTLYAPDIHVDTLPNANSVGRLSQFHTDVADYACLNNLAFQVWAAPSVAGLKGLYLIHASCLDNTRASTWAFATTESPIFYKVTWQGNTYPLSLLLTQAPAVEDLHDAMFEGIADVFSTNDSRYQCVAQITPRIYVAKKEFPWPAQSVNNQAQATYVIHATCASGTEATWTFTGNAPVPFVYQYGATWHRQQVTLKFRSLPPGTTPTTLPNTADWVTGFVTDDPTYVCFETLQYLNTSELVSTTTGQPTGDYFVEDQCATGQSGSWTFTPKS
jgi:hypothetical protein